MSDLRLETWTLPAANLGPENPLPVIYKAADIHANVKVDDSVPAEDREHLGWGQPPSLLPYRLQDDYDRARTPRAFHVVVLENERLRAAFFPEVGGRLWSLVHKASGRELLSSNPVFQPGHLAIRNAWISSGVEWNIGWTGHWPYTCSSLFAAKHVLPDGTPALRMWEWERVRQTPFQIDAWLPDGAPVLLVRVAIHNPHDHVTPTYWWSNIAVPERSGGRVLVSADETLLLNYATNGLACVRLPLNGEEDVTYPGRQRGSRDCFFRVPRDARPWITALDEQGQGIFQTSTARLRGRKLFRWGNQTGGRQWPKFLGTPPDIEIQAGLARTQSHHLPMPPRATWSWIEAYGDLKLDPAIVHGDDWRRARLAAADAVERVIPAERIEAALRDSEAWASVPPREMIQHGSGWGALEEARRAASHEPALGLPGVVFPSASLGSEQEPWLALMGSGHLPVIENPLDEPGSFVTQLDWQERLERSLTKPRGRHWVALFHLGVMHWQAGRPEQAVQAWKESCETAENPWARRCLGAAARAEGRFAEALPHLQKALEAKPDLRPMLLEYLGALLDAKAFDAALAAIAAQPPAVRANGRIRFLEGRALLGRNDLDGVERLLAEAPIPDDLNEGEGALCDLWFELQARRAAKDGCVDDELRATVRQTLAPPARIDYRMGG